MYIDSLLRERARRVLPGGTLGNVELDLVIQGGRGARVWDTDGNEYVDYVLGSGPMILGHAHPEVVEAVTRQLQHGSTFFLNNPPAIQLAERIVEAVPCAEQIRFTSSGSEATLYAMRIARAHRKCDKILKFEGGYHGMNDYALMSTAPKMASNFPQPVADSAGIPEVIRGEVIVAPFNDTATAQSLIDEYRGTLAAVIVEPFQRLIPPARGFLEGLRSATQKHEILLIFDEIVTGFRFAYGGAQEFYGVVPDLCTLGKIIGGGFPLAAVAGKRRFMQHFDKSAASSEFVIQIGTLSGNPIAATAGLATLDVLRRPGTYHSLFETGKELIGSFNRLLAVKNIEAKIVGESPLFDVFFTSSPVTDYRSACQANDSALAALNQTLLRHGVLKGDTKFYISTAHNSAELEKTKEAFSLALDEISAQKHLKCVLQC